MPLLNFRQEEQQEEEEEEQQQQLGRLYELPFAGKNGA